MKFLVDAQLPPALARWLEAQGFEAQHVVDLGLGADTDRNIWKAAQQSNSVIVTKDEDFAILSTIEADGPPVVWIRVGNTTRRALLTWFEGLLPQITQKLNAGENLVEVV